jgi:hypothetical protein
MNTEIPKGLKAAVLKQYSMLNLNMECIAKNFQLPDKRLDGVVYNIRGDYALCLSNENHLDFFDIDEWILPLRALSSITDSEAIEVAKIVEPFEGLSGWWEPEHGKRWASQAIDGIAVPNAILVYQYLQQKGFALPVYYNGQLFSVADLEQMQIIKLIE